MEVYVDEMIVKSKTDVDHSHNLRKMFNIIQAFSMKLNPNKCMVGVRSGKFLAFMISSHGIEANPDKIRAVLNMKPPQNIGEVQRLTGCIVTLGRFMSLSSDANRSFTSFNNMQTHLGPAGGRTFPGTEDVPGSASQNHRPLCRRNTSPLPGRFGAGSQRNLCGGKG